MCVALPSDLFDFITFKKYSFVFKGAGHKSYAKVRKFGKEELQILE